MWKTHEVAMRPPVTLFYLTPNANCRRHDEFLTASSAKSSMSVRRSAPFGLSSSLCNLLNITRVRNNTTRNHINKFIDIKNIRFTDHHFPILKTSMIQDIFPNTQPLLLWQPPDLPVTLCLSFQHANWV